MYTLTIRFLFSSLAQRVLVDAWRLLTAAHTPSGLMSCALRLGPLNEIAAEFVVFLVFILFLFYFLLLRYKTSVAAFRSQLELSDRALN